MRLLLISGSTRAGSTNTAALNTIAALAPDGVTAELHDALGALPAFNPDDDWEPWPEPVVALRSRIAAADAVLFCTPEYAGALPGSFKNLLDWTVGGGEIYGKPVAWVNVAAPGRGAGALAELRTVLGYVGAEIVDAACADVPLARDAIDADGLVGDPASRQALAQVISALQRHIAS